MCSVTRCAVSHGVHCHTVCIVTRCAVSHVVKCHTVCSAAVWQMLGNENISHPVGTAACPSIVQQILAPGRVEGSRTEWCVGAAEPSCWTSGHDWLELRQVHHCASIISRLLLWRSGFDFTAGRMNYCCFFSQPLRCLGISAAFNQTFYCDNISLTCSLGTAKQSRISTNASENCSMI